MGGAPLKSEGRERGGLGARCCQVPGMSATSKLSWLSGPRWIPRRSGLSGRCGHFRLHALHKFRGPKCASRLKQVLDFECELVNGRISGRNTV